MVTEIFFLKASLQWSHEAPSGTLHEKCEREVMFQAGSCWHICKYNKYLSSYVLYTQFFKKGMFYDT